MSALCQKLPSTSASLPEAIRRMAIGNSGRHSNIYEIRYQILQKSKANPPRGNTMICRVWPGWTTPVYAVATIGQFASTVNAVVHANQTRFRIFSHALLIPLAQAQVTIDASKITCDQFVHGKVGEPRTVAAWLSGFYNGKRNNALIDTQNFQGESEQVGNVLL